MQLQGINTKENYQTFMKLVLIITVSHISLIFITEEVESTLSLQMRTTSLILIFFRWGSTDF
jgi:hypothetical protein